MGLLTSLLSPVASEPSRSPFDDFWYKPVGASTAAGVQVTDATALSVPTYFACYNAICEDVAKLKFILYEVVGEESRRRARANPIYGLLHDAPNEWQTSYEFREMLTGHALMRPKAYARIIPNRLGQPDALVPLHPDRVKEVWVDSRTVRFEYTAPGETVAERIPSSRMFRISGRGGVSMVEFMRQTLGIGVAQRVAMGTQMRKGMRPSGVLKTAKALSKPALDRLRADWNATNEGAENQGGTVILEEGMEWHQVQFTNRDTQTIELLRLTREEIADFFRMPHHKVGILDHATFTNIEHQSLEYVTDTLLPWLTKWEQCVARDLIADNARYFAEMLVETLLRADTAVRYAAYATARQWGFMSPNEIRARENLNPIEGGDVFLQPMNMVPLGSEPVPSDSRGAPSVPTQAVLRQIAVDVAARAFRRETNAIVTAAKKFAQDDAGFGDWVTEFYAGHRDYLLETLHVDAGAYCRRHEAELVAEGVAVMERWEGCATELAMMLIGDDDA